MSVDTTSRPRPPLLMDPRIRRRRIEVRREEGRRRLRLVVVVLGMVGLGAGGWLALRSPLLDVDVVRVQGTAQTAPSLVRDAAGIDRGMAMVDVDEGRARRAVEALPWVERATVRRAWPATVSITVVERTALAVTSADGGRWAVVDGTGRVLEHVGERPPGLVVLERPGGAPPPGSWLSDAQGPLSVAAAVPPALATRVRAVAEGEGGELQLKLEPRGTVRFGPATEVEAKLRALETVLARVDTRDLDVLDLRVPSSPVLTRA